MASDVGQWKIEDALNKRSNRIADRDGQYGNRNGSELVVHPFFSANALNCSMNLNDCFRNIPGTNQDINFMPIP